MLLNNTYKNKIFFTLKEHGLIQQVIINTLLNKKYFIDDLAKILGTSIELLYQVQDGKKQLAQDSALTLINLFYQMANEELD